MDIHRGNRRRGRLRTRDGRHREEGKKGDEG